MATLTTNYSLIAEAATTLAGPKYLRIYAKVNNQSVTGNYTDVDVYMTMHSNTSGSYSTYNMSAVITVNGSTAASASSAAKWTWTNDETICSGTIRIPHEADGSKKNVPISASLTGYHGTSTVSGTFDLTTIPRASKPTLVNPMVCGTAYTINLNRASTSFTHNVTWTFGTSSGTLSTNAGASVSWTPAESLAAQFTSAKTMNGTLTVVTYSGSTTIGTTTTTFTLQAKQGPTFASSTYAEVGVVNGKSLSASPFSFVDQGLYGLSCKKFTFKVSPYQNSTVKSVVMACGTLSKTIENPSSSTTYTLQLDNIQNETITLTATDARGMTTVITKTVAFVNYYKPSIDSFSASRASATGSTVNANAAVAKGKYYVGSIGSATNAITVTYSYTDSTDTSQTKATTVSTSSNVWTAKNTAAIENVSYLYTFPITITATDTLGYSVSFTGYLNASNPTLWVGKNTVRINDYLMVGKGISVPTLYVGRNGENKGNDILSYFRSASGVTWKLGSGTDSTRFQFAGVLTGNKKQIIFTVTPRVTINSQPTVTALKANIRNVNGSYIVGTSGSYVSGGYDLVASANDTVSVLSYSQNMITIKITAGSTSYGGTDNTPVNVDVTQLHITYA